MGRLFGTDGIRGIVGETLTAELALSVGRAAGVVLAGDAKRRPRFVIGCDPRASSDMLCAALTAGLCEAGADVWTLGVIPTPAVAFSVGAYKADAGIMVSASHNPAAYNGIKLFGGDGFKLPDALEERIETLVLDEDAPPPAKAVGTVTAAPDAADVYIQHLQSTALYDLSGLKIAVDCGFGAASRTAKALFSALHADAIFLNDTPNGYNVNERCGSTDLRELSRVVAERGLQAGVAFDGDADRCLCVDERGDVVDGDRMMAACALDMKQRGRLRRDTVVGTVMSNLGFLKFCEQNGLHFLSAKVGDRYVLEQMLLADASFGGEQSGHLIFRDFATTGDGQLTAVQLLSLMRRTELPLSALCGGMTVYPQKSREVAVSSEGKVRFYTEPAVRRAVDEATARLGEDGRVVVRPSGTEPLIRVMAQGEDETLLQQIVDELAATLKQTLKNC